MPIAPLLPSLPPAVRGHEIGLKAQAARQATDTVGVVGAGAMGAGIAQVALEAGWQVILHDVDPDANERARARVRDGLARRAEKLDLDAESIELWVDGRLDRLVWAHTLDGLASESGLVIEAALEDLDLKRTIFRALDAEAPADVILATNTSALSVTAIAEATTRPERVLGLHFFNPVPLMALVEVVPGANTAPHTVERAIAAMRAWGKTPVRSADSPGFIVNRVNRPFTLEALRMLQDGLATVDAIDLAMRVEGFPMGPFELMDLTGVDVTTAASRAIHAAAVSAGDPRAERFRPSPIQEAMVEDGRLGRKTGQGFYGHDEVGRLLKANPGPTPSDVIDPNIAERINLAIINEAYAALGDGVATPADIDLAMRLGARHPIGPFERVDAMGGPSSVLAALERHAPNARFEPAEALLASTGTGS